MQNSDFPVNGQAARQLAAPKPSLDELLAAITLENCHPATDWGRPGGKGKMVSRPWTPELRDLVWMTRGRLGNAFRN